MEMVKFEWTSSDPAKSKQIKKLAEQVEQDAKTYEKAKSIGAIANRTAIVGALAFLGFGLISCVCDNVVEGTQSRMSKSHGMIQKLADTLEQVDPNERGA